MGDRDKQKLAIEYYSGEKRVLEIGCSCGNISAVFKEFPDIEFLGIDIDQIAIDVAKKRFSKNKNFIFLNISLDEIKETNQKFNYILVASILHHVDNSITKKILNDALAVLAPKGKLVICEPNKPGPNDPLVFHRNVHYFEKGEYLRTQDELLMIINEIDAKILTWENREVNPRFVKWSHPNPWNIFSIIQIVPNI
jgi:2-polyprenyl-3-methyl-5-hydroxy-6-metoxy-1,4-benzoquinol methylase|tara:strand:+ start:761 stop:1348 length:588 start_codon:yes stop_codon:yes gene_type:complete